MGHFGFGVQIRVISRTYYNFIINQGIYSKDEVFSITFPSLTIGLTYSLYKTNLLPLYDNVSENTYILFGEYDQMNNEQILKEKLKLE